MDIIVFVRFCGLWLKETKWEIYNVDVRLNESETRGMRRLSSAKTQIADRMHTFISRRFFIVVQTDLWMFILTQNQGNRPHIIMHCRFYCLPLYVACGIHIIFICTYMCIWFERTIQNYRYIICVYKYNESTKQHTSTNTKMYYINIILQ